MFVAADDRRWPDMAPAGRGRFFEEDFHWISDWGFNFVRLPLSYLNWSGPEAPLVIDEAALAPVDGAIEWGRRAGLHVNLSLHHVPGYCINATPRPEPFRLWRDDAAVEAFIHHWHFLARRYAGVSTADLSFDLVNEPHGQPEERPGHDRAVRAAVRTIRAVTPDRLIVADGWNGGNDPHPTLVDLRIGQSCRGYAPASLTHYQAWWSDPRIEGLTTPPTWPLKDPLTGGWWDRKKLEESYRPWRALLEAGIGVHCGECGCWTHTPHATMLAWMDDLLSVLTDAGIGWALWNFRGSFGLLDTGRTDVPLADWHGHTLDRELLTLLQRH